MMISSVIHVAIDARRCAAIPADLNIVVVIYIGSIPQK